MMALPLVGPTFRTYASGIESGAIYKLINPNSGMALDVAGAGTTNGTLVQTWDDTPGDVANMWQINDIGGGVYTLVNPNSGKALDVYGAATANGSQIVIWDNNPGDVANMWQINDIGGGNYVLVNPNSGRALDVNGASTTHGAKVQLWDDTPGDVANIWQLVKLSSPGSSATVFNDEVAGVGNNEVYYPRSPSSRDNIDWAYDTDKKYLTGKGQTYTGDVSYQGDLHWSTVTDAYLTIRFNGAGIRLYGMKSPDGGKGAVSIDGGSETLIDYYSSSFQANAQVYDSPTFAAGQHVLKLRVTGTHSSGASSANEVTLDRVEVSYSTAVSVVDVDDFTTGSGTNQFYYPAGTWGNNDLDPSSYYGTNHASATAGEYLTIAFVGNQIEFYGVKGPNYGSAAFSIDNGAETTQSFAASAVTGDALVYRSPVLSQGSHTLKVRNTSNALIVVDKATVVSEASATSVTPLTVNTSVGYQTIDGFGASSGWYIDPIGANWSTANLNTIADLLYSPTSGAGLSSFRFYVGAGSTISDSSVYTNDPYRQAEIFKDGATAAYDWSKQAGQQWMMQAAQTRGATNFIAFTHSPPFWLTKNGHTRPDGGSGSTNLASANNAAYGDFLADVLQHFRDVNNVNFNYISPVNEPGWSWESAQEEGNRASNGDIAGQVNALYASLQSHGLTTKIAAPEAEHLTHFTSSGDNCQDSGGCTYLNLYDDATTKSHLNSLASGHSYWTDDFESIALTSRRSLKQSLDAKGLDYWQTEYAFLGSGRGPTRDSGITPALWTAKIMNADLTELNAKEWDWWLSVSNGDFKDGLLFTDWHNPGDSQNIIQTKTLWAMGNFSRFIRPGSQRVQLAGLEGSTQVMGSAYVDTANRKVVTVLINESQNDRPVTLDIQGQSVTSYTPYVTSDASGDNLSAKSPVTYAGNQYTLPARSIVTLVASY
jgi:O-glycosyl hydrolase